MLQHVARGTRHRQGQNPSLLDLIFTLDPDSVDGVSYLSPLGSSDHVCLLWKLKLFDELPASNKSILKYNYRKGDYEAVNENLGSISWSEILSSSIHDDWHVFKEIVQDSMAKYIPTSTPKRRNITTPWWSKSLSKALKAKQLAFTRYKRSKLRSDYANYTAKCNDVKYKI